MSILTFAVPTDIMSIPFEDRWKAILHTATVAHSTNDTLFNTMNMDFKDIRLSKRPILCLKGEQRLEHTIELVFVHQLPAEQSERSELCVLAAEVNTKFGSVNWSVVSTHTETEVFTVASDGNFIACNTQEEYMLFSAANEDGPIVTESRNSEKEFIRTGHIHTVWCIGAKQGCPEIVASRRRRLQSPS